VELENQLTESKMISSAWKVHEDETGIGYRLQIAEVPWKFRKVLFEAMKDWNKVGVGWTKDTGNQIFIFDKNFRSESEWLKWVKAFPLEVSESKIRGEKEKIIVHRKKKK
jgi:hypothetical protein